MEVAKPKVKGSIEDGNITAFAMISHSFPAPVRRVLVLVLQWVLVCTCVSVLYVQWTHIWMLRVEMAELTQRFRPLDTSGMCCDPGVSCYHRFPERRKHEGGRDKRDVTEQRKPRKRPQNDHDTTVLSWAIGQSRGAGLQLSGDTVTVEAEGPYFIYSQVLYKDPTWVMGHVITKRLKGAETKLMKCLKSMPSNVSQPLNTCYSAGIYFLESGSTLQLSVPRKSAELILTAHATFMGLFSI